MMPLGLALFLLAFAAWSAWRVRAYLLGGGFWFPQRWRVTRAKDPITFWCVVVAYGAVAAVTAIAGLVGFVGAVFGNHHIPS
jgi:hypothetical protein